jgi:hypothetical protein
MVDQLKEFTDHATIIAMDPRDNSLMVASNEPGDPMALLGLLYSALDEIKQRITHHTYE